MIERRPYLPDPDRSLWKSPTGGVVLYVGDFYRHPEGLAPFFLPVKAAKGYVIPSEGNPTPITFTVAEFTDERVSACPLCDGFYPYGRGWRNPVHFRHAFGSWIESREWIVCPACAYTNVWPNEHETTMRAAAWCKARGCFQERKREKVRE